LIFSLNTESRNQLSDVELIERYRHSYDNAYIGELFQRYTHMLFGVCMKYLKDEDRAKDAVMDVFEKVLKDLKRHKVDNFRTWVYSVTKNQCLMTMRKQKSIDARHDGYTYMSKQIMESDLPAHLNEESEEETDRKLNVAIGSLKDEQQKCIRLFYFEKRSYEQIEVQTGYSIKQVKSYLQNGKRNLKMKLSKVD